MAVTVGLFLAAVLVVLLLLIYDESRYRSCIEGGGLPAGKHLGLYESIDRSINNESRPEKCDRVSPF
ncbi:MAG: hypothetical protein JJE13_09735 [Thermoleophilia bacterium]|nr:hypothetical protein [Thermoleophilia bacterium]